MIDKTPRDPASVVVYDGRDIHQAKRLMQDMPLHEGIEHVQSGIHVTVFENGHLLIEGYGTAQHGDPLPGMEVRFDPIAQTMRVQNKFVVRGGGDISEYEGQFGRPASQAFSVTFTSKDCHAAAEALLKCAKPLPTIHPGTAEAKVETGRFVALCGARGTLEVEIRDPGKLEHSSLCIRYLCPVTGHAMRLIMDENTAHFLRQTAQGHMEQAVVEMTGEVFAPYDVRHQPGKTVR